METPTLEHQKTADKAALGFWVYLMTDLIMFAALFAAFVVLRNNTYGGPNGKELFSLPFVLTETIILLISSFSCGLAMLALEQNQIKQVSAWLAATFVLGATFLVMEFWEFHKLISEGHSWQQNAFLSSYFSLVGTHGLHILIGLIWIAVSLLMIKKRGISPFIKSKLSRLALFWHFLDIVWIFIFTIVYLYAHI